MTPAERHIRAKLARGERITPLDQLATIEDADELTGFWMSLATHGLLTAELNNAIDERRVEILRARKNGAA